MSAPSSQPWPRWLGYVSLAAAAWIVFILLTSTLPVLSGFFTWEESLRMTLNQWLLWILCSPFMLWFTMRYPLQRSGWLPRLAAHAALGVTAVWLCAGLSDYLLTPPEPPHGRRWHDRYQPPEPPQTSMGEGIGEAAPDGPPPDNFAHQRPPLFVRARFHLPIGLTLISLCHTIAYMHRSRQRERQTLALEAQLVEARLHALRMQLHPHFLFNTLNAISTLVQTNPTLASEMIGSLGQMLRQALDNGTAPEVPLAEEMRFLDAYLEIEQLRLGERLQVHRTLSPGTATALVPTFILQPLVENAIRHGIEPLPAGGNIAISAQIQDQLLILTILDSGVGLNDRAATNTGSRPGIGLANTRARLQNLYPGRHEFKIKNPAGGGCLAELTIPCHSEPVIPQPFPP
ncbi:MAG TPA: sensor histidine kinase [Verrucomicrobiae bacterium]